MADRAAGRSKGGGRGEGQVPTSLANMGKRSEIELNRQLTGSREFFHAFFPNFLPCASLKNYRKKT